MGDTSHIQPRRRPVLKMKKPAEPIQPYMSSTPPPGRKSSASRMPRMHSSFHRRPTPLTSTSPPPSSGLARRREKTEFPTSPARGMMIGCSIMAARMIRQIARAIIPRHSLPREILSTALCPTMTSVRANESPMPIKSFPGSESKFGANGNPYVRIAGSQLVKAKRRPMRNGKMSAPSTPTTAPTFSVARNPRTKPIVALASMCHPPFAITSAWRILTA